ncbi:MAG TPA: hypothetical protein VJN18_22890, partial [Polyangiaceae bacterium]|nr:hypothetical protein [Polyangiaceae bacterium]
MAIEKGHRLAIACPRGNARSNASFFSGAACGLGSSLRSQVAPDRCNQDGYILGGLISAVILTGVGVPLI